MYPGDQLKSAVILVGGKAKRAEGKEKYFFSLEGKMFIERAILELSEIVDEILIIGRDHGQADRFTSYPQTRYVPDELPGRGPLMGLITGAKYAKGEMIFAVACDMPFINKNIVLRLFSLLPGYEAVIPVWENGYIEPLYGVYSRSSLLSDYGFSKNHSFRDYFKKIRVRNVPVLSFVDIDPDLQCFTNINSIGDYDLLITKDSHKQPQAE